MPDGLGAINIKQAKPSHAGSALLCLKPHLAGSNPILSCLKPHQAGSKLAFSPLKPLHAGPKLIQPVNLLSLREDILLPAFESPQRKKLCE